MTIARCVKCGATIITTRHINDKSNAKCGNCLFDDVFEKVWEESDRLSVGHSDYWAKMKLRVRERLKEELVASN